MFFSSLIYKYYSFNTGNVILNHNYVNMKIYAVTSSSSVDQISLDFTVLPLKSRLIYLLCYNRRISQSFEVH